MTKEAHTSKFLFSGWEHAPTSCQDICSIYAKNAGGEIDLPEALLEMMNRGKAVPGGCMWILSS